MFLKKGKLHFRHKQQRPDCPSPAKLSGHGFQALPAGVAQAMLGGLQLVAILLPGESKDLWKSRCQVPNLFRSKMDPKNGSNINPINSCCFLSMKKRWFGANEKLDRCKLWKCFRHQVAWSCSQRTSGFDRWTSLGLLPGWLNCTVATRDLTNLFSCSKFDRLGIPWSSKFDCIAWNTIFQFFSDQKKTDKPDPLAKQ